jgi:hypothetical protein
MARSQSHTSDDIKLTAKALIMIAPSREFAAGVAALAYAHDAADDEMVALVKHRWQFWSDTQYQLPLAQE